MAITQEKASPHGQRAPSGRQSSLGPRQKKQVTKSTTVIGGASPVKSNSLAGLGYQTTQASSKQLAISSIGQLLVTSASQSRCQAQTVSELRTNQSSQSETVGKRHAAMKPVHAASNLPLDLTPTHHQVSSGNTTSKKAAHLSQHPMRSSSSQSRHHPKRAGSPNP